MKRLELGARARSDLAGIWAYTDEQWGEAQATRYTDALNAAIAGLANTSGKHRLKVGRHLGLRVGSHVIYYRELTTVIRVVCVLHTRMDARRHLPR